MGAIVVTVLSCIKVARVNACASRAASNISSESTSYAWRESCKNDVRYASTVSSRAIHEFSEISTSKTLLIASAKRSAVSKRTRLPVDAISDLISKSRQRRSSGSARASRHKGRGPPSAQTTTNNQIQPRLRYASTAVFVVVDPVLGQGCWRHARFCLDASRVRLRVGAGK